MRFAWPSRFTFFVNVLFHVMPRKMVALNRDSREIELWQRAESKARQEMGDTAREGEVLARICADYLNEKPPFPQSTDA